MSTTMQLALQLTAVDLMSAAFSRVKQHVLNLGEAGKKVKRDFEVMEVSVARGLKGIAVSAFLIRKELTGIKAAGSMEEAMLKVETNLASGAANAAALKRQLGEVRATAIEVSKAAPFSAEEVVNIENALLKAGVALDNISGKGGAAWAATALATLSDEAPDLIGESLARIGSMFNLEGSQYGDMADWLSRVDEASSTNIPELIQGLRMAGATAKGLGIPAKDAVTALGALAPLGERAGSSLNMMLVGMIAKTREQWKLMKSVGLDFFDEGKFIGMARATEMLREKLGGMKDLEKRNRILSVLFGEEGFRAAGSFIDAAQGFTEVERAADKALSAAEKMEIRLRGMGMNLKALGGTWRTTLGAAFDPLLGVITAVVKALNDAVGAMGKIFSEHRWTAGVASGTATTVALAAGGFGLWNLIKGGKAGMGVLKGLGGIRGLFTSLGSTAAGVAQGKALQAAAGVTPVFVTNWPADFGAASALTAAAGSAGTLGSLALGAGKVGLVGAAAYGAGTLLNMAAGWLSGLISGGKYKGSGWLGDILGDLIYGRTPEVKNAISMNVNIDRNDRITVESRDPNSRLKVNNMRRGPLVPLPAGG